MRLMLPARAAFLTQVATLRAESPTPSIPYDWSNVAMGGAGFVSGVFAHPAKKGLFYARTDVGGIYQLNPATMDIASIPGGPLISAIWDYAGFTNSDPAKYSEFGQFRVAAGLNVRLASAGRGDSARVNDDGHQFGGLGNGGFVKGDMSVFGRVYMSSPGRGIPYGTPSPHEKNSN